MYYGYGKSSKEAIEYKMINPMNLTDKKIMIVGTISGIGKAIACQLSALGAKLVLVDDNELEQISLASSMEGVSCYTFNYLNCAEILQNFKQIVDNEGKMDGYVFTVTHSDFRPLNLVDNKNLTNIMNNNFSVFIESVRCLMKSKGINEGGSIVVMSSISSIRAMKAKMAFCSSKAATDAAVRCLAAELGSKQIRVNSVQKGGVDVDLEKSHVQDIAAINNNATEQKQILGLVKSEEIGNTVAFLLGDAAKSITGTAIVIDGGYTL